MTEKSIAFETSDIYFAAFLSARGYQLTGTNRFEDKGKDKTRFIFTLPEKEVEVLKSAFFGGKGEVIALAYMHSLRSLKALCFI